MITIPIKPLSVNQCWQGKRFKTKEYERYEKDVMALLVAIKLPHPPYCVHYEFGFSNSMADIDNPVKPVQDILQKRYGFNDRDIYEMVVVKEIVKKGDEYIRFAITPHLPTTK